MHCITVFKFIVSSPPISQFADWRNNRKTYQPNLFCKSAPIPDLLSIGGRREGRAKDERP